MTGFDRCTYSGIFGSPYRKGEPSESNAFGIKLSYLLDVR